MALFHHVTDVRCLIGTKVGMNFPCFWKVDIRPVTLTTARRSLDFLTFLHSKFGAGIKFSESYFSFVDSFNNSFAYKSYFVAIFTGILFHGWCFKKSFGNRYRNGKNLGAALYFGSVYNR